MLTAKVSIECVSSHWEMSNQHKKMLLLLHGNCTAV